MTLSTDLWLRKLAQDFFEEGGFSDSVVVLRFKNEFFWLLKNSSVEDRTSGDVFADQDFDLLALVSLIVIEAGATYEEFTVLIGLIERLEAKRFKKAPYWFSRLLVELMRIKHVYQPDTAWRDAIGLQDVVSDCAKAAFQKKEFNIPNQNQFLKNLQEQNRHRFGHPVHLEQLSGLRSFLDILSRVGSTAASYLLLLLRLEKDGRATEITKLERISEEEDRVCQLAKLHLGLVYLQNELTADEARKALRAALHDFEGEDDFIFPEIYEQIVEEAWRGLEKLSKLDPSGRYRSTVNVEELLQQQIHRIKICIQECADTARSNGWETMLPIWVSALAVESGKLAEALWKGCLIAHIGTCNSPQAIEAFFEEIGRILERVSDEEFIAILHREAAHRADCHQRCGDMLSKLIELWRPKKGVSVREFLASGEKTNRLQQMRALILSPEDALHEREADYPTLLLTNIVAFRFSNNHALGRLPFDGKHGVEHGLKCLKRTFNLRNDFAHYRSYDSKADIDHQLGIVRRSAQQSVAFAEVVTDWLT